jgi:hypothetical protein
LIVSKLNADGQEVWSRVLTTPTLTVAAGVGISLSSSVTVSKNGSILVHLSNGSTDVWQTAYTLLKDDGSLLKAWTFNESGRPSISPTLDGGFIIGSSLPVGGLFSGVMANLRLIRLRPNGDIQWTRFFSPTSGTAIGSSVGRFEQLRDSSFAMVYGLAVTKLSPSGEMQWSKISLPQPTTGFTFSNSTLVTSALMVSSANKIYTIASNLETGTIGVGRETPIVSEFDSETGDVRALGYPVMTGRFYSMLEVANGGGFWILGDTIVPLGAGMTRTVASRLMRTDAQFNAGCGAPILLNAQAFNANIAENVQPFALVTTAFDPSNVHANSKDNGYLNGFWHQR